MNKSVIWAVIVGIVILGGIVYALNKPQQPVDNGLQNNKPAPTPVPAVIPAVVEISVNYKKGQAMVAQSTRVEEGQSVVINVVSDTADELHLHGYDLSVDLKANVPATLKFEASKTGRFEFELEELGKTLGVIEVYPK